MAKRITVSEYLIEQLKEIGVDHLFTVPGDYAGPFLSQVDKTARIERVGVTNKWWPATRPTPTPACAASAPPA